jgi:hypothetical protein
MPSYSSYITAAQAVYDGLTAANFPGATRPPGPYMDAAPVTDGTGLQVRPPYVVMRDLGSAAKWTFSGNAGKATPGQNAIVDGEFVVEAYAVSLGDCDRIIAAILWNGAVPNNRAGLAFATFTLDTPLKGIAGYPVPTRNQRGFAGVDKTGAWVHVTKQWFAVKTAISGDGT